jgi:hypothetical protein
VSWSHLPRHHHPPGAVYEQHYGTPDDLALDYKSVTLGEPASCGSVHYEIRLFGLLTDAAIFRAVSPQKRDQVRLRSRL